MRKSTLLIVALMLAAGALLWSCPPQAPVRAPVPTVATAPSEAAGGATGQAATSTLPAFLPSEARGTLRSIANGGPFPHRQDGGVFGNREGLLPHKPRGYYREYTVDTPGLDHRGARRIVTGGDPPEVWYYTDDHYGSFRAFEVGALERRP